MKVKMLSRLLAVRQLCEKRAFDALTHRSSAFQQAGQRASEAGEAVAQYAAEARERERKLIQGLVGQPVPLGEINGFQSDLDRMSVKSRGLHADEHAARASLQDRKQEMDEARVVYNSRQKALMKLNHVMKRQAERGARKRLALEEASSEERAGLDLAGLHGTRIFAPET